MYQEGQPLASIREATGVKGIHSVLRQEGIEPNRAKRMRNPQVRRKAEQKAIKALQQAAAELETDTLRLLDYRAWQRAGGGDAPSDAIVKRLFGSWKLALATAGLNSIQRARWQPICDESDLIRWMQDAAGADRIITMAGYDQWREQVCPQAPRSYLVQERLGWVSIREKAGLLPRKRGHSFSDQELLSALRAVGNGIAVTPSRYENWRREQPVPKPPALSTITKRFGTWKKANRKARLKTLHQLTDRQLLLQVAAATRAYGAHPTRKQYQEWALQHHDRPGIHILERRYSFRAKAIKSPKTDR